MHESLKPLAVPSPAPEGRFGRFLNRLRERNIRVRRAGVPHEETVVIPAVVASVTQAVGGEAGWRFWVPAAALLAVSFLCGGWLGLAWRGFPVLRVLLRSVYIGVLTLLLAMLLRDDPPTKRQAIEVVLSVIVAVGIPFYFGWLYGSMVRDVVLKRFYSEAQRQRYLAHMAWRRRIGRLAKGQEDRSEASFWDWAVSGLVQSAVTWEGFVAMLGAAGAAIYGLWRFSVWLASLWQP